MISLGWNTNRESWIWVIIQSVPTAFHTFFVFLVSPDNHPWPCPFSFSISLVCLVFRVPHSPSFPVSAKICLGLVRHSIKASPLQFYFKNEISKNMGWIWYWISLKLKITFLSKYVVFLQNVQTTVVSKRKEWYSMRRKDELVTSTLSN